MPSVITERENKIKTLRTAEANRRNLMGGNGKLGVVARMRGRVIPLISEEDDFSWIVDSEPSMTSLPDERTQTARFAGFEYDGVREGRPLIIRYIIDECHIQVHHEGDRVYEELGGELKCFVPNPVWEGIVDRIFQYCQQTQEKINSQKKEKNFKLAKSLHQKFRQYIKTTWGWDE